MGNSWNYEANMQMSKCENVQMNTNALILKLI